MCRHFLLQGIFLTQGSNMHLRCLLHWVLYQLSPWVIIYLLWSSWFFSLSLSLSFFFLTLTRSSQTSNYCPLWIAIFIVWLIYKSNSKCLNWNLEEWVQINLKKFACTFFLYVLLISDCNIYDNPYILKKFSPGI